MIDNNAESPFIRLEGLTVKNLLRAKVAQKRPQGQGQDQGQGQGQGSYMIPQTCKGAEIPRTSFL